MNTELREMLGKAAYTASYLPDDFLSWEQLDEESQEEYRKEAEAVAIELAQVALPALQGLAFAFTGKQIELHFEENT